MGVVLYSSSLIGWCFQEGPPVTEEDQQQGQELRESFKRIAGDDLEVDAYELKDILNSVFTKGILNYILHRATFLYNSSNLILLQQTHFLHLKNYNSSCVNKI